MQELSQRLEQVMLSASLYCVLFYCSLSIERRLSIVLSIVLCIESLYCVFRLSIASFYCVFLLFVRHVVLSFCFGPRGLT